MPHKQRKFVHLWRYFGIIVLIILGVVTVLGSGGDIDFGDSTSKPTISIENPTTEPIYATTATSVTIGGRISGASFAEVLNVTTGSSSLGYVFYNDGIGTWFSWSPHLVPGDNLIKAIADADGSGTNTAEDSIIIRRPLQPYTLIINAADSASAINYWTDIHSFNKSHKIALFADGTGLSTTGNVFSEDAGATVTFAWSVLGPEAIQIDNCPTCSFQQISRISGSLDEEVFQGQVETVSGADAYHSFYLDPGTL